MWYFAKRSLLLASTFQCEMGSSNNPTPDVAVAGVLCETRETTTATMARSTMLIICEMEFCLPQTNDQRPE